MAKPHRRTIETMPCIKLNAKKQVLFATVRLFDESSQSRRIASRSPSASCKLIVFAKRVLLIVRFPYASVRECHWRGTVSRHFAVSLLAACRIRVSSVGCDSDDLGFCCTLSFHYSGRTVLGGVLLQIAGSDICTVATRTMPLKVQGECYR